MHQINTSRGLCRSCTAALSGDALTMGFLPPLNRFSENIYSEGLRLMQLTACVSCGLTQQTQNIDVSFIRPRKNWINYNEPDGHLDSIEESLCKIVNLNGLAVGVGPFDLPLLKRLALLGMSTHSLNLADKNYEGGFSYLETIQSNLCSEVLEPLVKNLRAPKVVVFRYLLEHCDEPVAALRALSGIMADDGILFIEVPDSSKFIELNDYSFIWEEHVSYFVEDTFLAIINNAGLEVVKFWRISGELEDLLVVAVKKVHLVKNAAININKNILSAATSYFQNFESCKKKYQTELLEIQNNNGKIALLGIGHQALMFVNAFNLQSYISYYIDDDKNKIGLYPAGISQTIFGSDILVSKSHELVAVLMAINPSRISGVAAKMSQLKENNVKIYSIFRRSNETRRLTLYE